MINKISFSERLINNRLITVVGDAEIDLAPIPSKVFKLLHENLNELVNFEKICEECFEVKKNEYTIRSFDVQYVTKIKPFAIKHGFNLKRVYGKGIIMSKDVNS